MAPSDKVETLLEEVRRLVIAGKDTEPLVLNVSQRADISAEDGLSLPDGETPLMQFSRITLDDIEQQAPIPPVPETAEELDLSALNDTQLRELVRHILHEELQRLGITTHRNK
ncbi:hypothetical protein [Qingshengfaniella alkalisoli]|uniref:Uncharacterized protein n=1 Tax=Qingshengfaniella alkalisoli TaxID=2599296 RepID=A0A5B8J503_9RHOB|nr:hypothetical protein [Qingshengfaniella alkalisoli]QDY69627.1 hypothetical protein FPZ52_08320 [Qingshengfaniella alkalisoli]